MYGEGSVLGYEYRMHDTRIGRFWSVDPLTAKFPWNSPYAFAENSPVGYLELEGLEAILFVENEGVGHAFVGVFTEQGIRVYTYGRYYGSYFPSSGQFGMVGDGVLLRFDGEKASDYINNHFNKGNTAKAYLIPSAKPDKIINFYENLLSKGSSLPKFITKNGCQVPNEYYEYGKKIDIYSILGHNCVSLAAKALNEGGFDIKKESLQQSPPIGIISPSNLQLMIDVIIQKDNHSNNNPRIYDSTKDLKEGDD